MFCIFFFFFYNRLSFSFIESFSTRTNPKRIQIFRVLESANKYLCVRYKSEKECTRHFSASNVKTILQKSKNNRHFLSNNVWRTLTQRRFRCDLTGIPKFRLEILSERNLVENSHTLTERLEYFTGFRFFFFFVDKFNKYCK